MFSTMILDQLSINGYPFLDHGLNRDINRGKKIINDNSLRMSTLENKLLQ